MSLSSWQRLISPFKNTQYFEVTLDYLGEVIIMSLLFKPYKVFGRSDNNVRDCEDKKEQKIEIEKV